MKFRKLQNPFFLIAQGFLAGGLFLFVSMNQGSEALTPPVADSRLAVESLDSTR